MRLSARICATFAWLSLLALGTGITSPSMAENAPQTPKWVGIIVHTTDSGPNYGKEQCDADHKKRGFDGCGYSYMLPADGGVIEVRGDSRIGAHTLGKNKEYLGVAFIGRSTITSPQLESFSKLLTELESKFGPLEIRAHREFNKNKTCPGDEVWEKVRDL